MDEILGENFIQSIGYRSSGARVWHSPDDLFWAKTFHKIPHYFFKWQDYINRLVKIARELGVQILVNSEVIEPIHKENICIGVKYKDKTENVREIYGNAILGCEGHESVIGTYYKVPYKEQINCPIIKCLISNANIDIDKTPDLQFYFIGNGDLEHAPNFPQSVAYIFPIGGKNVEAGLMLRMTKAYHMKSVKIPNHIQIMAVWEDLKRNYPGFSEFFKGAMIDYEELTALSNAKLVKNYIPSPGTILIGDSAGFVDPFGSSGLYYAMEAAKFWVNILCEELLKLSKGNLNVSEHVKELWNSKNIKKYQEFWEKTPVFKHVKKSYFLIGIFEWYIFKHLRTSERINKKWKRISWLLNVASK